MRPDFVITLGTNWPLEGQARSFASGLIAQSGVPCYARTLRIADIDRPFDNDRVDYTTVDDEGRRGCIETSEINSSFYKNASVSAFKIAADMTTGQIAQQQVKAVLNGDKVFFQCSEERTVGFWPFVFNRNVDSVFRMEADEFSHLWSPTAAPSAQHQPVTQAPQIKKHDRIYEVVSAVSPAPARQLAARNGTPRLPGRSDAPQLPARSGGTPLLPPAVR
ncbi:MAG: hypothetical protein WDO70_03095 [Alphaproteobacteria bacterium]